MNEGRNEVVAYVSKTIDSLTENVANHYLSADVKKMIKDSRIGDFAQGFYDRMATSTSGISADQGRVILEKQAFPSRYDFDHPAYQAGVAFAELKFDFLDQDQSALRLTDHENFKKGFLRGLHGLGQNTLEGARQGHYFGEIAAEYVNLQRPAKDESTKDTQPV